MVDRQYKSHLQGALVTVLQQQPSFQHVLPCAVQRTLRPDRAVFPDVCKGAMV